MTNQLMTDVAILRDRPIPTYEGRPLANPANHSSTRA